jgi:hypothetical protein
VRQEQFPIREWVSYKVTQLKFGHSHHISETKKPIPPPRRRKTGLLPRRDILDKPIPDILNRQLQKPNKPVRAVKPLVRTSEFKDDTLRTFDPPNRKRYKV